MTDISNRPQFFTCHNGDKAPLPFSKSEYDRRLGKLRAIMAQRDIPVVLLTSMQNIAYYSGFLYCAFGRPYGCVVTQTTAPPFPPILMPDNPGAGRLETM